MRKMSSFICQQCGFQAFGRKYAVESGRAKYCSQSCKGKAAAAVLHLTADFRGCRNPNYKGLLALTNYEHRLRQKAKHPERVKARDVAGNAIRRGKLTPLCCEKCGASEVQAHHDDYAYPLDVRWLCVLHHNEAHDGRGTGR